MEKKLNEFIYIEQVKKVIDIASVYDLDKVIDVLDAVNGLIDILCLSDEVSFDALKRIANLVCCEYQESLESVSKLIEIVNEIALMDLESEFRIDEDIEESEE